VSALEQRATLTHIATKTLGELRQHIQKWQACGCDFSQFLPHYKNKLATLGQEVEVRNAHGSLIAAGKAVDVTLSGELVVSTADGLVSVATGELTLRKPH
jgi:biotin-(acetyl-CoA carboxylase) ligase